MGTAQSRSWRRIPWGTQRAPLVAADHALEHCQRLLPEAMIAHAAGAYRATRLTRELLDAIAAARAWLARIDAHLDDMIEQEKIAQRIARLNRQRKKRK